MHLFKNHQVFIQRIYFRDFFDFKKLPAISANFFFLNFFRLI